MFGAALVAWGLLAAGMIYLMRVWALPEWVSPILALSVGFVCAPIVMFALFYVVIRVAWHTGRPDASVIKRPPD